MLRLSIIKSLICAELEVNRVFIIYNVEIHMVLRN